MRHVVQMGHDDQVTISLLERAYKAGFDAMMVRHLSSLV